MHITKRDLLKIKMSSNDIANLLCLSPSTVESHRYRIRKKMQLEPDLLLYLSTLKKISAVAKQ